MSLLSDVISQAKSKIKVDTQGTPANARSVAFGTTNTSQAGVTGVVSNAVQSSVGRVTGAGNAAVNAGAQGVAAAISKALQGDVSGGLERLVQSPSDVLGSLASSFGLGAGSILSDPGSFFGTGAGMYTNFSPLGTDPGNSLGGALARPDPMLSFCWYAILPDIAPLYGAPKSLPWYFIEEATAPFRNIESRPIFREGRTKHYPSTYSVDSLRLAIYQDSANIAMTYLNAWQGAVLRPTTSRSAEALGGGYGRPSDYKRSIFIYLLSVAKKELAVLEYTGCWPQTIDAYSLNSNSSDRILNQVTFPVDDVFINIYAVSQTALSGFLGPGDPSSLSPGEEFVNL